MLCFQPPTAIGLLALILSVLTAIKMAKFNSFMHSRDKDTEEVLKDQEFEREALVITCFSIMLELFSHLFISIPLSCGYYLYSNAPKIIIVTFSLTW
mmetsp:Transcript_18236/g.17360  ORF Transcript_18236/g.17360 Transcript_18236/m.17360 type:complete len:97 (+) Transcript_18236:285-575(+)